jgi:hypothetical protein
MEKDIVYSSSPSWASINKREEDEDLNIYIEKVIQDIYPNNLYVSYYYKDKKYMDKLQIPQIEQKYMDDFIGSLNKCKLENNIDLGENETKFCISFFIEYNLKLIKRDI